MSGIVPTRPKRYRPEPINVAPGWFAGRFPVSRFPFEDEERLPLQASLLELVGQASQARNLEVGAWLLADSLHRDGAIRRLSEHGREWLPSFGLGLWPDREPPHMYEEREFLDLEHGAALRRPMHSVVRVGRDEASSLSAWKTMFGTGSTVLALAESGIDSYLDVARQASLSIITDETFRSFPWYFPLLGVSFIHDASAATLTRWAPPLYIRESEEDEGIVMLASPAIAPMLRSLLALEPH